MKLIPFILGCCLSLTSSVFAASQHPQVQSTTEGKMGWAYGCEVEIVNRSYDDVTVFGDFDDGCRLIPFNIYAFEASRYIPLQDEYGYCHRGMSLHIVTFRGQHVFSGYVYGGRTVYIVPYMMNQVKAVVGKAGAITS